MRFLKVLGLVLLFLISMMFFVQNTEIMSQEMTLHLNFYFGDYVLKSRPLPFYFLLLAAFGIGALLVLLFFLMDKIRMGAQLKDCQMDRERLEQEVNSLRNLPLENSGYSPVEAPSSTASEDADTSSSSEEIQKEQKDDPEKPSS